MSSDSVMATYAYRADSGSKPHKKLGVVSPQGADLGSNLNRYSFSPFLGVD